MASEALADAGMTLGDVDGLCCIGTMVSTMELAEYLGIQPTYTDNTMIGGASFETHVEHAAAAIFAGLCDTVLIVYAGTPRWTGGSDPAKGRVKEMRDSPWALWEAPFGARLPVAAYALAANRHQALYGTTREQLAEIVVASRQWGAMNPNARRQQLVTVDEVLASAPVAEPLHALDCCLVTDGAGALVVTRADRAPDLPHPPVFVLGAATSHTHSAISAMPDLTVTAGAVSGPRAFAMAGITAPDVDVLQAYDSFTITVLLALEDLGFCAKGEGGPFAASGALGPGGALPSNTNGGGLSYTHPGMYGIFLLVEAVRQLRGGSRPSQVPGAEVAVAHGCGGVLSATATVVLGTEATR